MTLLGKILLFVNLALSLAMATIAFGIWTNRIDFSNNKATAEQTAGEFAQRSAAIESLWETVPPAEMALRSARTQLVALESQRVADLGWYQDQIKLLREDANPAVAVKYATDDKQGVAKGQMLLDKDGRPVLEPARDLVTGNAAQLKSLVFYQKDEQRLLNDLATTDARHKKQIEEATGLTERLVGTPGKKGLRTQLVDEQKKDADVVAEQDVVRPQLINAVVDSELILKRHNALKARVEELEKVGVASRGR